MEDNLIFPKKMYLKTIKMVVINLSPIVLTTFEVIKLSLDSFSAVSKKSQCDARSTESYECLEKRDKMFVYQL